MHVSKCNLCGSVDFEDIYKIKDVEIVTTKEKFKIDINNVICRNCGLVFQNPYIDEEKLELFYSNQYKYSVNESRGGNVRKQQKKYIEKFLNNKKGKILDIGCFEGFFLNLFKEDGWNAVGLELSSSAAQKCREKYNIKIYNDALEHVDLNEKEFDVISIIHALEHVNNPMNTILLMKKYLKDDGLIFIEVPNIETFNYYNITDVYNFQHIYNFSVNVLKNYLNICGLEIIDVDVDVDYEGMRFICKKGDVREIENYYEETKGMVLKYKYNREKNLQNMSELLLEKNNYWKKQNKRIYIYGAGSHTSQLFQYVIDKRAFNIHGLIDMDDSKENKEFCGYKIYNAKKIDELDLDVIIISSYPFQNEIYTYLSPLEEKGIEVIKLYKDIYSYDTL